MQVDANEALIEALTDAIEKGALNSQFHSLAVEAAKATLPVIAQAFAERDAEIERLREALEPFGFLEVGQNEDEPWTDTQSVWEAIYNERVHDWISFEEIQAARQALGATDEA